MQPNLVICSLIIHYVLMIYSILCKMHSNGDTEQNTYFDEQCYTDQHIMTAATQLQVIQQTRLFFESSSS